MIKLDKTNFWNCLVYKELAYDDSAPEYILQYLRDLNIKLYKGEGETLTSSLLDYPKKEDLGISGDDNYYQVVHYIGPTQTKIKYRRHHLNEYLRESYSVKTLYISDKWDLLKKPGCLIVSAPQGAETIVSKAISLQVPIYYDRTDYWNASDKYNGHIEDELLKNAKVITCSSRYLADITKNGIRIDNGAEPFNYTNTNKENIAVYIGKEDHKLDLDLCEKWRKEYPDYRFVSIGTNIPNYENLPYMKKSELMKFLSKCKLGLIPLKDTEYCKAQFNLKYWDYKQAGLDILLNIPYNYEDAKIEYWPEVCRKICNAYGLPEIDEVDLDEAVISIDDIDKKVKCQWRLSLACNFRCPYCIQGLNKGENNISLEEAGKVAVEWGRLISNFMHNHPDQRLNLNLIGGEPSLYPLDKYITYWNSVATREMDVIIITNLSLHDAEWWNSLAKPNIKIGVIATLHHSQVSNIDEWLQKVYSIKDANKIKLVVKQVATNENIDEVKKYYKILSSHGVNTNIDIERDGKTHNIIADEAYKDLVNYGVKCLKINDNLVCRAELVKKAYSIQTNKCKCWHKTYISGKDFISGCKLKADNSKTIYDLDDIQWIETSCDRADTCSYCNAGKVLINKD